MYCQSIATKFAIWLLLIGISVPGVFAPYANGVWTPDDNTRGRLEPIVPTAVMGEAVTGGPPKFILVLDVDLTLANTVEVLEIPKTLSNGQMFAFRCKSTSKILAAYRRPWLRTFIKEVLYMFEIVVIYTAGNQGYAENVRDYFINIEPRWAGRIYARSNTHCDIQMDEFKENVLIDVHKNLDYIIPAEFIKFVVVIDDRVEAYSRHPLQQKQIIRIPPWAVVSKDSSYKRPKDNQLKLILEFFQRHFPSSKSPPLSLSCLKTTVEPIKDVTGVLTQPHNIYTEWPAMPFAMRKNTVVANADDDDNEKDAEGLVLAKAEADPSTEEIY